MLKPEFLQTTLANGLTIVGERHPSAKSAAIGFFVKTGARDEQPTESGVSHFLEHMMFKGTKKRTALDINYGFGNVGAQSNAFTSEENTVYYAAVLPEYLSDTLEILSDMLRPLLDQNEFDVEKNVILEEIALYKDRPTHVLFEETMRLHFQNHTAGNSVLGTIESITNLTRDQMQQYFDRRYSAPNIVLAVSGSFDWDAIVTQAEEQCSSWSSVAAPRQILDYSSTTYEHTIKRENLQHAHACLVAEGPSVSEDERYSSSVLSSIIGDSSGSRVYWELVDKGLADSASIDTDEMEGTGIVYGYVSSTPDKLSQVTSVLENIMNTAEDFTDEQLHRTKTKIATRLVLQGESPMRRLMAIGLDWNYRQSYLPLEESLEKLKKVDRKSISKMLERYPFKPTTKVTMVPSPEQP